MTLRGLHGDWAWVVVFSNGIAGAWALVAHWRAEVRTRWLWRFTALAEVAIFVQAVLGAFLLRSEPENLRRHAQFHMFYGFVAAFTVAIIYSYRNQLRDYWYLLYGLGGLFLMGLGIRAMVIPAT